MKRLSLLLFSSVLIAGPASAYTGYPPMYQQGVPNLLGDLLAKRGAATATVEATKTAVAQVISAEAAAAGVTLKEYSWARALMRANMIAFGVTAVAITADKAYKWYTDDGGQTITDWNGNLPSVTGQQVTVHSGWIKDPGSTTKGEVVGWAGYYRSCMGAQEIQSCMDDDVLAYLWYVYLDNYETSQGGSFRDYKVGRIERSCDAKVGGVTNPNQLVVDRLAAAPTSPTQAPWTFDVRCDYTVDLTYTVVDDPGSWFPNTTEQNVTLIIPQTMRPTVLYSTGYVEDELPECKDYQFQADLDLCASNEELELPNTVAYPSTEKPTYMPGYLEPWTTRPNPDALATLLDDLWKRASQMQQYIGVPYSVDDPLTGTELRDHVQVANPPLVLDDLLSPVADPQKETVPWAPTVPSTGPVDPTPDPDPDPDPVDPDPDPDPDPNPTEPDPGVPEPAFPEIPTIQEIMDPVLTVFPEVKSWSMPSMSGDCPIVDLEAFDRTYVLESHCVIAEENRPAIGAVFMAFYALTSVLIVLRA